MISKSKICLAVLLMLAATAVAQQADIECTGMDVARVTLEDPHVIPLPNGGTKQISEAYLVRVHGRFPVNRAPALRMFVGDAAIEEVGSFPGGVYFYVWDLERLRAFAGKVLRYGFGESPVRETTVVFPTVNETMQKPLSEKRALERPAVK
ncbi:MAG: hypothetical protein P9L99_11585 [Candidatus Lernaella stagnicola]|nr:hypothetical protein [Candidatus Lernaella stagnicola]